MKIFTAEKKSLIYEFNELESFRKSCKKNLQENLHSRDRLKKLNIINTERVTNSLSVSAQEHI